MQSSKLGKMSKHRCLGIFITVVSFLICGCGNNRHAVIAVTGTNIGLEISENPTNQMPQGKLGYQRTEIAIVPSNRSGGVDSGTSTAGHGAKDVTDVLMELKFSNIFQSFREGGGIYQRLAVGENAVKQPGAAFMFARDQKGEIGAETAAAIRSIESIRSTDPKIREGKAKIVELYRSRPDMQTKIKEAVTKVGYKDWDSFLDGKPKEPSLENIEEINKELK